VATVVSIVAGALLLKEPFTIWQVIGAAVIIIGVYTANTHQKTT
ncbi:MAG: EamA family transporter, partial [Lachnospiraceae bacterium]|nr:EamA family transporter [Lachnospiraceae bacterium]